jgi:hypothetical protein
MPEIVYSMLLLLLYFLQKSSPVCSTIPIHAHKFTDLSSQIFLMQYEIDFCVFSMRMAIQAKFEIFTAVFWHDA